MSDLRKAAEKYIRPGTVVDVDVKTTAILVDLLRQALAQPEQEPVAWRNTETGEFCTGGFLRKDLAKWTPLYTAPPKRKWVGLTRLELDIATLGLEDLSDCYKAIEAKLKEKNT